MAEYWFKPRAYGYGATPSNWKGWAAIACYLAVVVVLLSSLMRWENPQQRRKG